MQAPQTAWPQAILVPVSPQASRMKSASVAEVGTSAATGSPLTVQEMETVSLTNHPFASRARCRFSSAAPVPAT